MYNIDVCQHPDATNQAQDTHKHGCTHDTRSSTLYTTHTVALNVLVAPAAKTLNS